MNHLLFSCSQFKTKTIDQRKAFVISKSLCFNCLRAGHSVSQCKSKGRCTYCKKQHHSLIHIQPGLTHNKDVSVTKADSSTSSTNSNHSSINISNQPVGNTPERSQHSSTELSSINAKPESCHGIIASTLSETLHKTHNIALLPTALVHVKDSSGNQHPCRLMLDSGSQVSFVTTSLVERLRLPRQNARLAISGLGATKSGTTKGKVHLKLSPHFNPHVHISVMAYILPELTSKLPAVSLDADALRYIKDYQLADPSFNESSDIDIILGADKFFDVLKEGKCSKEDHSVVVQNTFFGWVLGGKFPTDTDSSTSFHSSIHIEVDKLLRKFWETEEINEVSSELTEEEQFCENHFQRHTYRDLNGRYVVSLPIKPNSKSLGESYMTALRRLHSVERRFDKDPLYKQQYINFMNEYLQLEHMELIPEHELQLEQCENHFYLPHHAVFKATPKPKIRVVFDGSTKTSSGNSLNDILATGPMVQRDLFSILLTFRTYPVALTADLEKMYRQVKVSDKDRNMQRILWRENTNRPPSHYRLTTVTYGTASAPFLATRVLKQIALDYKLTDPEMAQIIENQFYVDDLLTGASSPEQASSIKTKLTDVFKKFGFNLTKWKSNCPALNSHLNDSGIIQEKDSLQTTKILGVVWSSKSDNFQFRIQLPEENSFTKRQLLSESSRIFDPPGLLAPLTVSIKILFQQTWLSNMDWDDELPDRVRTTWQNLRSNLQSISNIKVPRFMLGPQESSIEFHAFCDASEMAFGCVIYCRCSSASMPPTVHLMTAKTKVAPLKQVSLPRLELSAAVLLAKLLNKVTTALSMQPKIYAWTDSKIVLAWLSDFPRRWTTYVGNRTSQILRILPRQHWGHVPSSQNPADYASRGVPPHQLMNLNSWWNGPSWLSQEPSKWPIQSDAVQVNLEEERKTAITCHSEIKDSFFNQLLNDHSSWSKIIRIVAYCRRFISNLKATSTKVTTPYLLSHEFIEAECSIIRWVHNEEFSSELRTLQEGKLLSPTSPLSSLNPFVDDSNLLRVGGRLSQSSLNFAAKHPIILPKGHRAARLIAQEAHIKYLHPGPDLLISILRQRYWIDRVRFFAKNIVHQCVQCFRYRIREKHQLMGNLPRARVTPGRPFLRTGVDFAGPINLYVKTRRGAKPFKGYIALFVCFTTKALHLELVTSLSADSFLATLKRFVSRRGVPNRLFSDNGTNFIGAKNKLSSHTNELIRNFHSNQLILEFLLANTITWHLIPPASPNFGGLWEAGVKSVKSHLNRIIGNTALSYEEMATLLTQIEALLNSRPLCPQSDDPDSLSVLTPGHFLIGDSFMAIPDPNLEDEHHSIRDRWKLVQCMVNGFWRKWSRDYLTSLNQRAKWRKQIAPLKPNILVIISETNLPPACWALGRILEVHPGPDGLVRVVTIKTSKGIFKRPAFKVHPLRFENCSSND